MLDASVLCDGNAFEPCGVAPALFRFVLGGGELGIVDEDVGTGGKFADAAVDGGDAVFVIATMDNDGTVGFEAVAGCALGVVHGEGVNGKFTELFTFLPGERLEVALGGEELEGNREVGVRHLAFENVAHFFGRLGGVEADVVGRAVEGSKEGDALNVIPMEVSHEDIDVETLARSFLQKVEAEKTSPGAPIDHDDSTAIEANFQARGVAAETEVVGRGSGNAASYPPEFQLHSRIVSFMSSIDLLIVMEKARNLATML